VTKILTDGSVKELNRIEQEDDPARKLTFAAREEDLRLV
jgi:hypothetical protein